MAVLQSFGKNGEIDKDKLIENLQDVDGVDPSTIPSDSDFDFPLTIVVDDYEVVIEENGDVHIEGEESGNTNTTPGGNTNTGSGNTNTGGGNTNTNPGGNTNTGGDNGTGGGNTSGEDNEAGENNGSGDTNTTNEIEIPDAGADGIIEVSELRWDNGTASITISKGAGVDSSLKMQYKKADQSDDQYVTVNGNSETISGLKDGDIVIVRLTDGKGNYGGIKTINIEDANNPIVIVNQGTVTETSIAVTVNATDSESGIPSPATYKYYIKKSTEENYPTEPNATEVNATYTFTELDDNTKYDIKVEVADRAENTGTGEATEIQTLITIPDANADGAINVSDPQWNNGTASITITKGENVDESLYIEYKKEGDSDYTRLEGDTITGLTNGEKIYIHLTEGTRDGTDKEITINDTVAPTAQINLSATSTDTNGSITATVTQTDAETGINITQTKYVYNTTATEIGTDDASYTGGIFSKTPQEIILNATTVGTYYLHVLSVDNAGNKKETISEPVTVEEPKEPAGSEGLPGDVSGLTPVEGNEDTGIVAKDEAGNEWVWVEVPKSIFTTATSDTDYDAIYNDMKTYTADYSDNNYTDAYVSGSGNFASETEYNNEKNRMLKSVYNNGGFWISRYEIGTFDATEAVAENTTNVTPLSQQNAYPIVNKTQPQSQQIIRKINSKANLLFGVQWDLTLKFLQEKANLSVSELNSDSTSWGNYGNATFTADRGQYNTNFNLSSGWTNATSVIHYGDDMGNNSWRLTTGAADYTKKMNIYDLAGNIKEWTLEKDASNNVIYRGGSGNSNGIYFPAGSRNGYDTNNYDGVGLRASLYGNGTTQGGGSTEPQTGAIEFGNLQWDSGYTTASVTVSKTEGNTLDLQYRINEGEWKTIESGSTISNLHNGDIVIACLFDGTNRGYYTTLNVVGDITPPTAQISLSATSAEPEGTIIATVTQTDNESGIDIAKTKYVYNTTSDEIGTNEQNYIGGTFSKNPQDIILSTATAGTYYLHVLSVDKAGNKKETISEAISVKAPGATADDIADNPDEYYGDYVDYQPSNGDTEVKWRIFYVGPTPGTETNNIYLIADDYISSAFVPNGKRGTTIFVNGTDYEMSFDGIRNDYDGSSDITNNLVRPWLSYLNAFPNRTDNDIKAVAYMLDTNAWSTFTDNEGKAEYAIGGPTLELYCASYNQKHPAEEIQYQVVDPYAGYKVKWSSDSSYGNSLSDMPASDSLYVINSNNKAAAMWLASPSAYNSDVVLYVLFRGEIDSTISPYSRPGFRPVVCLKSDVRLEQKDDGTFEIVDGTEQGGEIEPQTGVIEFGDLQWNSNAGTASVTVTKTEDNTLDLRYKINEGNWTTINNGSTIPNLKSGDLVTACLYDGNNRAYYVTLNVQDITLPSATISLSTNSTDTNGSITATVTQTDNESGINIAQTKYVYNTTATELGTDDESAYTGGTFSNNPQDIILNATTAGTYYLHVLSVDNAGNSKETISEAVTVVTSYKGEIFTPEDITDEIENGNVDDFYGKEVTNYEPSNGNTEVKWKVFYVGTNPNDINDTTSKIYLIADDYISSQYVPNGKEGTPITVNSTYKMSFNDVIRDYSGSSDVTDSLGKTWLSYLNSYSSSTYNNMKAVAYMLDTSVWSTFTDSAGKAEYAIGGPTLDLFSASYNQKYPTNTIQYQVNSIGYQLKWLSDSSYGYVISGLPMNDSLYVINSTSKASAMWLASPSGNYYDYMIGVSYDGNVYYSGYYPDYPGLRPLICLKPEVQLEQQADGNFEIVDDEQGEGPTEPQVEAIEFGNLQWDSSYTTASVTVSKTTSDTLELQYKVNDGEWKTVDSGYTITGLKDEDVVTACLYDGSNRGYYATLNVQGDRTAPTATIQFNKTTAEPDEEITATVTVTDNQSGVASAKYEFNTVNTEIGTDEASYTGTISGDTVTLSSSEAGTYYLHVLTIDRAGNKAEVISEAITVHPKIPGDIEEMNYKEGDESTGIVATDSAGNEWVWVEVPKSIYVTATSDTDYDYIYNDMKRYTSKYNYNVGDYYYGDNYVSGNGNFSDETAYNNEKNRMLRSVYNNGGFWISRYEIGTFDATEALSHSITTADVTTPVSQPNAYPIVYKTQAQSQQIVRKMNNQANLLFGIQWDLTMKFLEEKGGLTVSDITTNSASWGNYYGVNFTIQRGKYNSVWHSPNDWINATNVTKPSNDGYVLTTGASDRNKKMNIYDLAGNVEEWTLESESFEKEMFARGGNGSDDIYGDTYPAGCRNLTYSSSDEVGIRAALYGDGTNQDDGDTKPQVGAIEFGNLQWDSDNIIASVTVSKTTSDSLDLQYKINDGNWITIENNGIISNLKEGDIVTACLFDGVNRSYYATLNIVGPGDTAEEIAKKPREYYGKYVDYQPINGETDVKWKIFYAGPNPDDDNPKPVCRIYLIADDYISSNYAPNGKKGTAIKGNGYYTWFEDVIYDYSGTNDINSSLAKSWLSYLNLRGLTYESTITSGMKAVAYMLDTNVWNTFKDSEGNAEYAIGGPTLDLFCASYNQMYPTKTIQYQPILYGYQVKWSSDLNYAYNIDNLATDDNLYVINNTSRPKGMWLASPSGSNLGQGSNAMEVSYYQTGMLREQSYNISNINGCRPIVCLKPDVKLVLQSDNSYKIQ